VVCDAQETTPSRPIAGLPRVIVPRLAAAETGLNPVLLPGPQGQGGSGLVGHGSRAAEPSTMSLQDVVSYSLSAMTSHGRVTVEVIVAVGIVVAKSGHREARWPLAAVGPLWNQPLLIRVDQNSDSRAPLDRRVPRGRKHPEWFRRHARDSQAVKNF